MNQDRTRPGDVLTHIDVHLSPGQRSARHTGEELCTALIQRINKHNTNVRKKLWYDYDASYLSASEIPGNPLAFRLEISTTEAANIKLSADVSNQDLAHSIEKESGLFRSGPVPCLFVELEDHRVAGDESEAEDNIEAPIAMCSSLTEDNREAEVNIATLTDACPTAVRRGENLQSCVARIIGKRKYTAFDFWEFLQNYRGKMYRTPFDLSNGNGEPLAHMCVDKDRLDLLSALFHMGWWTLVVNKRIPSSSDSPFKGKTCLGVAQSKRSRECISEVKMYTEWEESLSPVMKSARCGDILRVRAIIQDDDVHYTDFNNCNALYWAVISGNTDLFQLLCNFGLDPKMRTRKNETVLHIACLFGIHQFVPILLRYGIDINARDTSGMSVFDRIAKNGDVATLRAFRATGFTPKADFMGLAAFSGRKMLLEYCLTQALYDVNITDQYMRTPLWRAVEGDHIATIRYLLKKGARLDVTSTTNQNVLHIAAEKASLAVAVELVTALQGSNTLEALLNQRDSYHGTDLCRLVRGRQHGRPCWHYVEVSSHLILLFERTNVAVQDASKYGDILLSGWGENPNQEQVKEIEQFYKQKRLIGTGPKDCTPLQTAVIKGSIDVAKLYLKHGANLNIKDKSGMTPLMAAAARGDLAMFIELERCGAKLSATNDEGKTAAEIAQSNDNQNILDYVHRRDYGHLAQTFLNSDVNKLVSNLSRQKLFSQQQKGIDPKKHIIDEVKRTDREILKLLEDNLLTGSVQVDEAQDAGNASILIG